MLGSRYRSDTVRALSCVLASVLSNILPRSSTSINIHIYITTSKIIKYRYLSVIFFRYLSIRKKPIFISPKKTDIYRVKKKPIFDIYLIFTDTDIKHYYEETPSASTRKFTVYTDIYSI